MQPSVSERYSVSSESSDPLADLAVTMDEPGGMARDSTAQRGHLIYW